MFGIGSTGIKVGEVYAEAGLKVNEGGFHEFDRRLDKASRDTKIPKQAEGKMDVHEAGFRRFDRNLDRADRHAAQSSHRIRGAMGAVAQGLGVAGIAAGVFGFKAVQAASDTNEALTASEQLFGRHAEGIERWSKRTAAAMGVSRREALNATNDYGGLFATIGLAEKEGAGMSRRLVQLASDLASFRNADPSEVLEALKSGLIGEAEPMRRFGALLTETRVQQEAWRTGIAKNGETLTEGQKVQARYRLILKDTVKAHGDYARTAGGLANQQRQMSARVDDLQAKIGTKLLPVTLKITTGFNKLLGEFQRGEGQGGRLRDVLGDLGDVAKNAGGQILRIFEGAVDFAQEHPQITKAAAGLGAAYLALKGIGTVSRATPIGRGISALTAAVAGAAVVHAATAITRRGGILGKLAGGFLTPGSTPARPLFVKEVAPFGGGGLPGGGRGAPTPVPTGGGGLGKGAKFGRLALRIGGRALGWIGVGITVGEIATGMEITEEDRAEINRRTGPGRSGRPPHDVRPGTVGDPRTTGDDGGRPEQLAPRASRAAVQAERQTERLRRRLREVNLAIWQLSHDSSQSLNELEKNAGRNFERIKDTIGLKTEQGRAAATRNFRAAASEIAKAMTSGRVDTQRGMAAIERLAVKHGAGSKNAIAQNMDAAANAIRRTMRRSGRITDEGLKVVRELMVKELRLYGLSEKDAIASANVRTGEVAGGRRRGDFAGGGIVSPGGVVGKWGERGRDRVHAVLGRGEAVLNWIQQSIVNRALNAAGVRGGLRDVFRATRGTRHHMAGGGIVGIPWAPGEEIASSVLPLASRLHQMFGSTISDAFDRDRSAGHQSPGHNVTGTAADWVGGNLLGLVRWTVAHGFKTLYNTPPGTPWPGHSDHAHVEFGAGAGGMGGPLAQLARVIISGRKSPLRDSVQAAVDIGRAGAQKRLEKLFGSVTMGPAGAPGGSYSKADLARLWVRAGGDPSLAQLMGAIALAESGGNPRAYNPSGASGLWQILGQIVPGDVFDPMVNARNAVAKYQSQGLGAWEAYTNGNYRQYLSGGGLVEAAGGLDPFSQIPQAIQEQASGPNFAGAEYVGARGHLNARGGRYSRNVTGIIRKLERAIDTLGNRYDLRSRRFDLTEEELINEGDEDTPPTFNDEAIKQRAKELGVLVGIRRQQVNRYAKIVRYLRRLQQIYNVQRGRLGAVVGRTEKRLKGLPDHGGSKEQKRARKTLEARLEKYRKALGTVRERLGGVREGIRSNAFERESTELDVAELRKELTPLTKHLAGAAGGLELPEWEPPDDGGAGDENAAGLERERAERAEAALRSTAGAFNVFGGPGDIGRGGSDAYTAAIGGGPGGPPGGGSRFMDPATGRTTEIPAGGDLHVHMPMLIPGDPRTLERAAGAVAAGFGFQPYVTSTKTTVEI